jgi:hypothetical protein
VLDELIKLHEELAKLPVPGPPPPPSGGVYKDEEDARAMYASALMRYLIKHESLGEQSKVKEVLVSNLLRTELGGSYKRDSSDARGGQTEGGHAERTESEGKKLMDAAKKAGFILQTELDRFAPLHLSIDAKKKDAVVWLTENMQSRYDAARNELASLSVLHGPKTDALMFHRGKNASAKELVERTRALAKLNTAALAGPEGPRDWLSDDDLKARVDKLLPKTIGLQESSQHELETETAKLGAQTVHLGRIDEQIHQLGFGLREITAIEQQIQAGSDLDGLDAGATHLHEYITAIRIELDMLHAEIKKEVTTELNSVLAGAYAEQDRVLKLVSVLLENIKIMKGLDGQLDALSSVIHGIPAYTDSGERAAIIQYAHDTYDVLMDNFREMSGVYKQGMQKKIGAVYNELRLAEEDAKKRSVAEQKAALADSGSDSYYEPADALDSDTREDARSASDSDDDIVDDADERRKLEAIQRATDSVASIRFRLTTYSERVDMVYREAQQALSEEHTLKQLETNRQLISYLRGLEYYVTYTAAEDLTKISGLKTEIGIQFTRSPQKGVQTIRDLGLDDLTKSINAAQKTHIRLTGDAVRGVFELTKKSARYIGGALDNNEVEFTAFQDAQTSANEFVPTHNDVNTFFLNTRYPFIPDEAGQGQVFSFSDIDSPTMYGKGMSPRDFIDFGFARALLLDDARAEGVPRLKPVVSTRSETSVLGSYLHASSVALGGQSISATANPYYANKITLTLIHQSGLSCAKHALYNMCRYSCVISEAKKLLVADSVLNITIDDYDQIIAQACDVVGVLYTEIEKNGGMDKDALQEMKDAVTCNSKGTDLAAIGVFPLAIESYGKLFTGDGPFLTVHGYTTSLRPAAKIGPDFTNSWAPNVANEKAWKELLDKIADPIAGIVAFNPKNTGHYVSVVPVRYTLISASMDTKPRYVILDSMTNHYVTRKEDGAYADSTAAGDTEVKCECTVIADELGIYEALTTHFSTKEQVVNLRMIVVTLGKSMHEGLYKRVTKEGYGGARIAALGRFSFLFNKARILDEYVNAANWLAGDKVLLKPVGGAIYDLAWSIRESSHLNKTYDLRVGESLKSKDSLVVILCNQAGLDATGTGKLDLDLIIKKGRTEAMYIQKVNEIFAAKRTLVAFGKRAVDRLGVARTRTIDRVTRPASNSFGISALARNMKSKPTRSTSFGEYVHRAAKHSRAASARHRS